MSYARFGQQGSDVYVYFDKTEGYVCSCCGLAEGPDRTTLRRATRMIRHLEAHRDAGDTVPERAFALLLKDTENASGRWEEPAHTFPEGSVRWAVDGVDQGIFPGSVTIESAEFHTGKVRL